MCQPLFSRLPRDGPAACRMVWIAHDGPSQQASDRRWRSRWGSPTRVRAARRRPAHRSRRPNVLLVTIDTLRADRLGCYGHARRATPTLDAPRRPRRALRDRRGPRAAHGAVARLDPDRPHAARPRRPRQRRLRAARRACARWPRTSARPATGPAAFVSGFPLKRRFGFDRGFDIYDDHLPRGKDPRRTAYVERTADRTTDAALRWLDAGGRGGVPASRPSSCGSTTSTRTRPTRRPPRSMAGAALALRRRDRVRGRAARAPAAPLDERRRQAPPLVLVTADHGESLGEHGEDTHGIFVYDATLRVPLIARRARACRAGVVPRRSRAASTSRRRCSTTPACRARAMRGALAAARRRGRAARRRAGLRRVAPPAAPVRLGAAPRVADREAQADRGAAPGALRPRGGRRRARRTGRGARSRRGSRRCGASCSARWPRPRRRAPRRRWTRRRRSGSPRSATSGRRGGAAPATDRAAIPKDGIGLVTRLGRNGMTVARTEPEKAIRELTALLAEDPGMLVALRTRAVAYAAAGRHADAVRDLRELEKQGALSAEDAVVLGDNLRLAGPRAGGGAVLERTIRDEPDASRSRCSRWRRSTSQERDLDGGGARPTRRCSRSSPTTPRRCAGWATSPSSRATRRRPGAHYARILELDPADVGGAHQARRRQDADRARRTRRSRCSAGPSSATRRTPRRCSTWRARSPRAAARPRRCRSSSARSPPARARTMALNGLGLTRLAARRPRRARPRRSASRSGSTRTSPTSRARCASSAGPDERSVRVRRRDHGSARAPPRPGPRRGRSRARSPRSVPGGAPSSGAPRLRASEPSGPGRAASRERRRATRPSRAPDREARGHVRLPGRSVARRAVDLEAAVQDARRRERAARDGLRRAALGGRLVAQSVAQHQARDAQAAAAAGTRSRGVTLPTRPLLRSRTTSFAW